VGPRAGLDDVEKKQFLPLLGLKLRPLVRPARSQSLYRLSHLYIEECLFFLCVILQGCELLDYIEPNGRMTDELERIWKEEVVASYDSQGYGGGIRPRFHTGVDEVCCSRKQLLYISSYLTGNTEQRQRAVGLTEIFSLF
jgi:hypothetical protein